MTTTLTTVHIDYTATAVEPIHHGAGTSGNTALLRTQECVGPDGRPYAVPFISGNSVRHQIRAALADHLLATAGAQPQTLSKAAVDLLYSGGALTKSGANVDLNTPRRVADILPMLTLLGYSAGAHMQAGKLYVSNLQLVCAENAWRLPAALTNTPQATRRAATYRGEEFGTRHDIARTPAGRYTSLLDAADAADSTQMIYDFQVVRPGAVFYGSFRGVNLTDLEHQALAAGLALITTERDGATYTRLGAKTAVGMGAVQVDFHYDVPAAYEGLVRTHADEILTLVEELVR